jgi:hypothetical protein
MIIFKLIINSIQLAYQRLLHQSLDKQSEMFPKSNDGC